MDNFKFKETNVCGFGVPILRVNTVSKEKMLIQNFNLHVDKTSK